MTNSPWVHPYKVPVPAYACEFPRLLSPLPLRHAVMRGRMGKHYPYPVILSPLIAAILRSDSAVTILELQYPEQLRVVCRIGSKLGAIVPLTTLVLKSLLSMVEPLSLALPLFPSLRHLRTDLPPSTHKGVLSRCIMCILDRSHEISPGVHAPMYLPNLTMLEGNWLPYRSQLMRLFDLETPKGLQKGLQHIQRPLLQVFVWLPASASHIFETLCPDEVFFVTIVHGTTHDIASNDYIERLQNLRSRMLIFKCPDWQVWFKHFPLCQV